MKVSGYTLLELMLVVAIISILASIAIPSYQAYLVRARVTEAILLTLPIKNTIIENALSGADNLCYGVEVERLKSQYIDTVKCEASSGIISLQTTAKAGQFKMHLIPSTPSHPQGIQAHEEVSEIMSWQCRVDTKEHLAFVPTNCQISA